VNIRKKILCTLGPATLKEPIIKRFESLGISLLRLNMSHLDIKELPSIIKFIKQITNIPICIDTEGSQFRTGKINNDKLNLNQGTEVNLYSKIQEGVSNGIQILPDLGLDLLKLGDYLTIDFNNVLVKIIKKGKVKALASVIHGGEISTNKAITVNRNIPLPPLTEKDRKAINIARDLDLQFFALSFANNKKEIDFIRKLIPDNAHLISKIESKESLLNLVEIITSSDSILIDRGDLSREISIESIPFVQKQIIKTANKLKTEVYVATNLLETMVLSPKPSRAEVNDIVTTLEQGADGLVLAGETAVGKYPVECVRMVIRLIELSKKDDNLLMNSYDESEFDIIRPHGGVLNEKIELIKSDNDLNGLKHLTVSYKDVLDCELIANGTYSPLNGFMSKDELLCVLNNNQLLNDVPWTLPIVLQLPNREVKGINAGERVVLVNNGKKYAFIDVDEIFDVKMDNIIKMWFCTKNNKHPGVAEITGKGDKFISGEVTMINQSTHDKKYHFTPKETRFVFNQNNWSRIIGFHTRNIPHRGHEFIQIQAVENTNADGLLISPVIGPKKKGDFLSKIVLESYEKLIKEKIYPENKVMLAGFYTYSRFAGPREAVFTAICRKNMGCSHFIIGRDHTGVGSFYSAKSNEDLFNKVGDLGMKIIFVDTVVYNSKDDKYEINNMKDHHLRTLSGSKLRDLIIGSEKIPKWFVRKEIQDILYYYQKNNKKFFT